MRKFKNMKRACLAKNTNTYEQCHASSIRPLKNNFVRMKTNKFFGLKGAGLILFSVFFISAMLFTACEKDTDENTGDPFFTIEGNPTGLTVDLKGKTQSYVVRSNRPWQIVAQSEGDWVKAFPNEGDDDGIFKIIVNENTTFDNRVMNFAFIVDGEEQAVLFRVEQEKSIPSLVISDIEAGKSINQGEQEVVINVKANVTYTYTSNAPWLTFVSKKEGTTATDLTFAVTANEATNSRIGNVTFTCAQFPELNATWVLTQEGKSEGTIVLFEDFNWLSSSPTIIFYDASNTIRYDSWSPEDLAHGWTSTVNTFAGSECLYATHGVAKLGKTSYGGDIISPKLSSIVGTKDLVVKFKAVPYLTAGGTQDDNFLNISIIGPGTISQSQFVIDNWPVYPASVAEHEAYCIAFWNEPEAERMFTISGATSETQIKFLGGDYDLRTVGKKKNRIFLDDIKVLIPN